MMWIDKLGDMSATEDLHFGDGECFSSCGHMAATLLKNEACKLVKFSHSDSVKQIRSSMQFLKTRSLRGEANASKKRVEHMKK